ncbi:MAG TPA: TIGR01777 family protein, partial [Bacteroidaceae bacterium]|nr:TIGR01777 family protein [Bacteroidaceae bacterium]
MKIAFAGYNGFIGSSFIKTYPDYNYKYLSRELLYSEPEKLAGAIEGADVVISLTGYPIIKRWTAKNRSLIRKSRIEVNRNLAKAIQSGPHKPELFISASAIGIYNNTGIHQETSTGYGSGFMSDVVKDWEESTSNIRDVTGVAYLRTGMVLGNGGGAFPILKKTTKTGLG